MIQIVGVRALRGKRTAMLTVSTGLAILLGAANAMADTTVKWLHLELDPGYVAIWRKIV